MDEELSCAVAASHAPGRRAAGGPPRQSPPLTPASGAAKRAALIYANWQRYVMHDLGTTGQRNGSRVRLAAGSRGRYTCANALLIISARRITAAYFRQPCPENSCDSCHGSLVESCRGVRADGGPRRPLSYSRAGHCSSGLLNFAAHWPGDSQRDRKYHSTRLQRTGPNGLFQYGTAG